jgi:hypothetical protein
MTEAVVQGNPNQWDVFVVWVYVAFFVLMGGYTWYLIRLNKRLKEQERDLS